MAGDKGDKGDKGRRNDDPLSCSFCGKTHRQAAKIIAGPGVYICDECVDLCNRVIDEEQGRERGGAPAPSPPLSRWRVRQIEGRVNAAVDALRELVAELHRALEENGRGGDEDGGR